ncbi:MAG: HlyC/CorC family transporter [Candidatus Nanopelagicaceae bacterium]|nr:HlyC/CorC family transporter [Candidatus Nanopelagicaceae bacterium]
MELFKAIALVLALIFLAAFFVAAEIALISLRDGQVKQLATQGKRGARLAKLVANPNRFLAAVQVGVTVCGFLSAALGAEKLGVFVQPRLLELGLSTSTAELLSIIGVTLVIAYFSLVLGELVPKRVALFRSEQISLNSTFIIEVLANIFRPVIWLLSRSTDLILRLIGIDPKEERSQISEEELMELVSGHKALTEEEREIVEEVFNSSEKLVNEVMVPRTEVDFMDGSLTVSKAKALAVELAHSRYPVVRGSSDEVIGFIHVRDLLDTTNANPNSKIQDLVRPIMYLPGTKGVLPSLTEMRNQRQHLAIVLDEYGGTDGIVTLENLVECLIGDIQDEYDVDESEISAEHRTGDFELDGLTSIEDLESETGIALPEGPYQTVSGFMMHFLGRMPKEHDVISINGIRLVVISLEGHRVGQLLISRLSE